MRLRIPLVGGAAILAAMLAPDTGRASSHREAPFISKLPAVDGTDFYMFNSYETGRNGYVTLLANYLPLQDAYGGPNYFSLDPDALYEIHVDNNGDGVEDITFQFQFQSALSNNGNGAAINVGTNAGNTKSVALPVVVAGPGITDHDNELTRNQIDSYKVNVVTGPRRTGTVAAVTDHNGGSASFKKPLDNIGTKTIADYTTYAKSFIYQVDIPGCTPPTGTFPKVFVGQRQEPFPVNLGQVFDLVNVVTTNGDPQGRVNLVGAEDQGKNIVADKNVTTIALEIPASCLVASGKTNIGGWTTASVRQARVINPTPTFDSPSRVGGPWVQVSRVGMPLVNEVIVGLKDKNKFNSSEPKDDGANFADYVTNPTLPTLLEIIFPGIVMAPTRFPRTDLLTAFALGFPNVNDVGTTPSEMIRLNTTATVGSPFEPRDKHHQQALGAATCLTATTTDDATIDATIAGCDPTGFPNGRRPGDDVVDIELRVAMGRLLKDADAPFAAKAILVDGATSGPLETGNVAGVTSMAVNFLDTFPYLNDPIAGSPGGS